MAEKKGQLFSLFRQLSDSHEESYFETHRAEVVLLPQLRLLEAEFEKSGRYDIVSFLDSPLFAGNLPLIHAFVIEAFKKLKRSECTGGNILKALKAYIFELTSFAELKETLSPQEILLPPETTATLYNYRLLRSQPPAKRAVPDGIIFTPNQNGPTLLTAVCDYKAHWQFELPFKQTYHYDHMLTVSDLFDNFNPAWLGYLEIILSIHHEELTPILNFDANQFRTIFCVPADCTVHTDIHHLVTTEPNSLNRGNKISIIHMCTSLDDLDRIVKALIHDILKHTSSLGVAKGKI